MKAQGQVWKTSIFKMLIQANDHTFLLPSSLTEYTISQRISFYQDHGMILDEIAESINGMPEGSDREFEELEFALEKAFRTFAFFSGIDLDVIKSCDFTDYIAATVAQANELIMIEEEAIQIASEFIWNDETWVLHPPELKQGSPLTFGELIDSKQMVMDMNESKASKWEILQHVCAIFLRKKGEAYSDTFLYENSDRLALMEQLPLNIALVVGKCFEQLSEFCDQSFPIFWPGSTKPGPNAKKHFSRWGWVNFLKAVAKEKVFDIPGSNMNSIQCTRAALAFDVLVYSSEEKEYLEAQNMDMEILYKKNKQNG